MLQVINQNDKIHEETSCSFKQLKKVSGLLTDSHETVVSLKSAEYLLKTCHK